MAIFRRERLVMCPEASWPKWVKVEEIEAPRLAIVVRHGDDSIGFNRPGLVQAQLRLPYAAPHEGTAFYMEMNVVTHQQLSPAVHEYLGFVGVEIESKSKPEDNWLALVGARHPPEHSEVSFHKERWIYQITLADLSRS